jgi:hypothetical protein
LHKFCFYAAKVLLFCEITKYLHQKSPPLHRLFALSSHRLTKKDAKKSLFIWQIQKKAVPLQPI